MMHVYKKTNLIYHSRYLLAKNALFETVFDGWTNQVFLKKYYLIKAM